MRLPKKLERMRRHWQAWKFMRMLDGINEIAKTATPHEKLRLRWRLDEFIEKYETADDDYVISVLRYVKTIRAEL